MLTANIPSETHRTWHCVFPLSAINVHTSHIHTRIHIHSSTMRMCRWYIFVLQIHIHTHSNMMYKTADFVCKCVCVCVLWVCDDRCWSSCLLYWGVAKHTNIFRVTAFSVAMKCNVIWQTNSFDAKYISRSLVLWFCKSITRSCWEYMKDRNLRNYIYRS